MLDHGNLSTRFFVFHKKILIRTKVTCMCNFMACSNFSRHFPTMQLVIFIFLVGLSWQSQTNNNLEKISFSKAEEVTSNNNCALYRYN